MINDLEERYEDAKRSFLLHNAIQHDDGISDDVEQLGQLSYLELMRSSELLDEAQRSHYMCSRTYRRSSVFQFETDLEVRTDGTHWLNEEEFVSKYRMTRDQLDIVTGLIDGAEVFKTKRTGQRQMAVKHQLMIYLHFVGHEGMTDRIQRQVFMVSRGSIINAKYRVVKAFLSIRDEYYKWPSVEERKNLSELFLQEHGFPNGFAVMDGTLLELAFTPRSDDFSDYHGRKFQYSLTVLVVNNDKREIIYYLSGFPGSAHDNRVWENTPLCKEPEKYFSMCEYILADTAFAPSNHCVPSYKCVTGTRLPVDEEHFNDALATPRVSSEHTIGMWKGRFGYLRKIRMRLDNDPSSLESILELIDSTVVLHNILIRNNDAVDVSTWFNELSDNEFSDMDDADRVPECVPLRYSVPDGAPKGTRREQLKAFIRETFIREHNYVPQNNCSHSSHDSSDISCTM